MRSDIFFKIIKNEYYNTKTAYKYSENRLFWANYLFLFQLFKCMLMTAS